MGRIRSSPRASRRCGRKTRKENADVPEEANRCSLGSSEVAMTKIPPRLALDSLTTGHLKNIALGTTGSMPGLAQNGMTTSHLAPLVSPGGGGGNSGGSQTVQAPTPAQPVSRKG